MLFNKTVTITGLCSIESDGGMIMNRKSDKTENQKLATCIKYHRYFRVERLSVCSLRSSLCNWLIDWLLGYLTIIFQLQWLNSFKLAESVISMSTENAMAYLKVLPWHSLEETGKRT